MGLATATLPLVVFAATTGVASVNDLISSSGLKSNPKATITWSGLLLNDTIKGSISSSWGSKLITVAKMKLEEGRRFPSKVPQILNFVSQGRFCL